ncbi:hypothetical protein N7478_004458 [Penicillium angulare]|uniref:uncharacterized protein n=1 Tax=Penicillium angulare TaxID=116970 RepID=UPI002540EE07|nr:uncharacterized protein N7478_004458 [Penicillium angulare]KAJ5279086.1 hypothetical protein N7478_004458 [Penicillium angulare]
MRFTTATIALFAGLAIAAPNPDTTVYETEEVTITSCGPEVTNCPASSHASTTAPVAWTTSAPGGGSEWTTSAPGGGAGAGTSPAPAPSSSSAPAPSGAPSWTTSAPAVAPTTASVPAGPPAGQSSWTVISHTTCVPTVVYSTIPVPSGTSPVTGGGSGPHSPSPVASSSVPAGASSAGSSPSASATPFNAAGTVSGSMGFAGLAAAAAYFLA